VKAGGVFTMDVRQFLSEWLSGHWIHCGGLRAQFGIGPRSWAVLRTFGSVEAPARAPDAPRSWVCVPHWPLQIFQLV
jgi:hypothetical protein